MLIRQYVEDRQNCDETKEARRSRTRLQHEAAIENPRLREAHVVLIGVAKTLREAGRYNEARTVLLTALKITLRLHFLFLAGRDTAVDMGPEDWAEKLRSSGAIDRETYRVVYAVCTFSGRIDNERCEELEAVSRRFVQITFATAEEAEAVDLLAPVRGRPLRTIVPTGGHRGGRASR